MRTAIKRFISDESGATAIEYGLMVALIAVVIIVAVKTTGNSVKETFNYIANCVKPNGTC